MFLPCSSTYDFFTIIGREVDAIWYEVLNMRSGQLILLEAIKMNSFFPIDEKSHLKQYRI